MDPYSPRAHGSAPVVSCECTLVGPLRSLLTSDSHSSRAGGTRLGGPGPAGTVSGEKEGSSGVSLPHSMLPFRRPAWPPTTVTPLGVTFPLAPRSNPVSGLITSYGPPALEPLACLESCAELALKGPSLYIFNGAESRFYPQLLKHIFSSIFRCMYCVY